MTDKNSNLNSQRDNGFGDNYEDEMFERDDEKTIKSPPQNEGGQQKITKSGYEIPLDDEDGQSYKQQKSSVHNDTRSNRQATFNIDENEQQQANHQMQQQSQQINNYADSRQGSAIKVKANDSQSQSKLSSQNNPIPIRGQTNDYGQINRPATQQNSSAVGLGDGQKVAGNGSMISNDQNIDSYGVRFGQNKGNFQGGIPDLKANTMNGYIPQGLPQRPVTQGGVGFNFPSQLNQTHFQTNPTSYEDFRSLNNPLANSGKKMSEKPPMSSSSYKTGTENQQRGRRQFITQILQNQNNSMHDPQGVSPMRNFSIKESSNVSQNGTANAGMLQLNRKKIREMLYGGSASRVVGNVNSSVVALQNTSQVANYIEKEQLQNERRNLKVQLNQMKEEMMKLKTKVQIQTAEMAKKDKDVEILTIKIQQMQMGQPTAISQKAEGNIFESFLVSQLKKQNRELRSELEKRDSDIEKLKRDLKLSKASEMEIEMQQYIEECMRLRGMLEQTYAQQQMNGIFQPGLQSSVSSQQQPQIQHDPNLLQNLALREQQFMEQIQALQMALQQAQQQANYEQEMRSQLTLQLMSEKEQREKNENKYTQQEQKMKKYNQLVEESKRKQKIIEDKNKELAKLKEESENYRVKANERDAAHNKNKELVTKYYGQQSSVQEKDKKIKELLEQLNELRTVQNLQQKPGTSQNNGSRRLTTPASNYNNSQLSPDRKGANSNAQSQLSNQNRNNQSSNPNVAQQKQSSGTDSQNKSPLASNLTRKAPQTSQTSNTLTAKASVENNLKQQAATVSQVQSQNQSNDAIKQSRNDDLKNQNSQKQTEEKQKQAEEEKKKQKANYLDYTPNMLEILFRAIKSESVLQSNDPPGFKNFYAQNKDDIQKEINHIFQLDLHDKLKEHLSNNPDLYLQVAGNLPSLFGVFSELEQQIHENLQIEDKDLKRYLIFHKILKNSDKSNTPNYQKLLDMFKNLQKRQHSSQENVNEVEVDQIAAKDSQAHKLDKREAKFKDNLNESKASNLQNESEIKGEEGSSTMRVNASIQESKAQFRPPEMPQNQGKSIKSMERQNEGQSEQVQRNEDDYEQDDFDQTSEQKNPNMTGHKAFARQPKEEEEDNYSEDQNQEEMQQDASRAAEALNASGEPGAGEEQQVSIQITEDQMLDIAEQVFQTLAEALKKNGLSIKTAFGKIMIILEQFEGEQGVLVIPAGDFLEALRVILGGDGLSDLEIACLMRVLSKPEIDHCIVVSELQLVLENFGILPSSNVSQDPNDSRNTNNQAEGADQSNAAGARSGSNSMNEMREQAEQKKQKQTKKKQIHDAIWRGKDSDVDASQDSGELIYQVFCQLLKAIEGGMNEVNQLIKTKAYEQLVKSKKKELKMELISKIDFLQIMEQAAQLQITDNVALSTALSSLLQIDAKYPDVLQLKMIQTMLQEVQSRQIREESEARTIQEFYKPQAEAGEDDGSKGAEVLNFDQLINEDDDEEYNHYLDQEENSAEDQVANFGGNLIQNNNNKHKPAKSSNLVPIAEDQINEDTQSPAKH